MARLDPVVFYTFLFRYVMQTDVGGSTGMNGLTMATEISSVLQSTPHLTPSKSQPGTHGTTASLESVDITQLRLLLSSPQLTVDGKNSWQATTAAGKM